MSRSVCLWENIRLFLLPPCFLPVHTDDTEHLTFTQRARVSPSKTSAWNTGTRNDLRVIHPLIWEMEMFTSASIKLLYKVDTAGHESTVCDSEGSRDAELSGKVIQNRDARRWPSAATPCSGEAPSRSAPMLFTQESEQERCHELRGSSPASPSTFPHAQRISPTALVLCTPAPSNRSQISLSNCVCCPVARTPHSSIPCQLCNFQGNFSWSPGH